MSRTMTRNATRDLDDAPVAHAAAGQGQGFVHRAVVGVVGVPGVVDLTPVAVCSTRVTMPVWSLSPESSQSNCTMSPTFTSARWRR